MNNDTKSEYREQVSFNIYNMKCNYRNCNKEIEKVGKRKYCDKKCLTNEMKYIKRDRKRGQDEKTRIVDMLIQIENNKDILELYNKIHKN